MINNDVVNGIKASVGELLGNYTKEMESAMAEEGNVTISLPVKIKQKGPTLDVEVGISFIKEKVKDVTGFTIDEQKILFGDEVV